MDKKNLQPNSPSNSPVSFRPITEGLGFHPFSDGLPYAPMGKNPKAAVSNGAGATAAGPARIAPQFPGATRSANAAPLVTKNSNPSPSRVPQISVPVAKKEGGNLGVRPPVPQKLSAPAKSEARGVAYLLIRFLAYLFDVSLNSLLVGAGILGLLWKGQFQMDQLLIYGVPAAMGGFFLVTSWLLIALQEILFCSSLGKFLFHLKLDGTRLRIVVRALLFPVSLGAFGLGIASSLFNARRSCWHDSLTGIQPAEK